MNDRKILVIGGLVVAGVAAYGIYEHFSHKMSNCEKETASKCKPEPQQAAQANPNLDMPTSSDVCRAREAVVSSVTERHNEAAQVILESLNTVFQEDAYESNTTKGRDVIEDTVNSTILSKTASELDDLLK